MLDTPRGRSYEASVGSTAVIKQFASLFSDEPDDSDGSSTGLNCLPADGGEPATLSGKLEVLNCLVFDTPHSFWVEDADELKADSRFSWLGFGDWECTLFADAPLPSCYKHDVALASLQGFSSVGGSDMDEAWNPRSV